MNRFSYVIPILNVRDVPASLDYYVNKLGFRKKWEWGQPPTFGCVQRDNVELFLCEGAQGHPGTWMSIFIDDVDSLYADYLRAGVVVRLPPTNMPWNTREMHIDDLDGHRLRLGSDSTGPADPDAQQRFAEAERPLPQLTPTTEQSF